MMRSAVLLPPKCDENALVTMVSGMTAVSALDASATERSKPTTFWNRLTKRSTNSGRNQNVNVRRTRSRSRRRGRSRAGSLSDTTSAIQARHARRASPGREDHALEESLDVALDELRTLAEGLYPPMLGCLGVAAALCPIAMQS